MLDAYGDGLCSPSATTSTVMRSARAAALSLRSAFRASASFSHQATVPHAVRFIRLHLNTETFFTAICAAHPACGSSQLLLIFSSEPPAVLRGAAASHRHNEAYTSEVS